MERIGETDLAKRQRDRVKENDRRTNWSNDSDPDPVAHNQNHGQGVWRVMDRLKKGDIIKCFSQDELEVTEEGLINDGYGFIEVYDMVTMSWIIKITEAQEAADEKKD